MWEAEYRATKLSDMARKVKAGLSKIQKPLPIRKLTNIFREGDLFRLLQHTKVDVTHDMEECKGVPFSTAVSNVQTHIDTLTSDKTPFDVKLQATIMGTRSSVHLIGRVQEERTFLHITFSMSEMEYAYCLELHKDTECATLHESSSVFRGSAESPPEQNMSRNGGTSVPDAGGMECGSFCADILSL